MQISKIVLTQLIRAPSGHYHRPGEHGDVLTTRYVDGKLQLVAKFPDGETVVVFGNEVKEDLLWTNI